MEVYDLYISVGVACRPAHHLLINNLRNESFPLDWQMGYSLDTVIHLFKTKFSDFFIDIEEDLEYDGRNRKIQDIRNNIVSIHHFPRDKEIVTSQKEFLKKMRKRFSALEIKLEEAKRVVLICNRAVSVDELSRFLKSFSAL